MSISFLRDYLLPVIPIWARGRRNGTQSLYHSEDSMLKSPAVIAAHHKVSIASNLWKMLGSPNRITLIKM